MTLNIGKPTGVCDSCGASLVRYVDLREGRRDSHEACPECDKG